MVEPTQIIAAHKQHRRTHRSHEVKHVFALVEWHTQPASAFKQQHFCAATLPVAHNILVQFCRAQPCALACRRQMR